MEGSHKLLRGLILLVMVIVIVFWDDGPVHSEPCECDTLIRELDTRLIRLEDRLALYELKYGRSDDYKEYDGE